MKTVDVTEIDAWLITLNIHTCDTESHIGFMYAIICRVVKVKSHHNGITYIKGTFMFEETTDSFTWRFKAHEND